MSRDQEDMLLAVPEVLRPLLPELCADLGPLAGEGLGQLGRGELGQAASTAHALKGACMRFGLEALTREASDTEEAARGGDGAGAARSLERFAALLASLDETLRGLPVQPERR